jgi:hypothetical protein
MEAIMPAGIGAGTHLCGAVPGCFKQVNQCGWCWLGGVNLQDGTDRCRYKKHTIA